MGVKINAETLRQIPLFADCKPMHLELLAFASERQKFAQGDQIIAQGEQANSAFLILSGKAELTQIMGTHTRIIAKAEPGTLLGETAMIGRINYSITATALEPVSTAAISYQLFLRVVSEYPEFGQMICTVLARNLGDSIEDFESVHARFAGGKSFLNV